MKNNLKIILLTKIVFNVIRNDILHKVIRAEVDDNIILLVPITLSDYTDKLKVKKL